MSNYSSKFSNKLLVIVTFYVATIHCGICQSVSFPIYLVRSMELSPYYDIGDFFFLKCNLLDCLIRFDNNRLLLGDEWFVFYWITVVCQVT